MIDRKPKAKSSPIGCLCEIAGAAAGFLLVTVVAFNLLPGPPSDAAKSLREAHGVYAVFFGLGGFAIGGFAGSWAGKILGRRMAQRSAEFRNLAE